MSKVIIVKGSDRERMVENGLNALEINPYKEKVVIKPNLNLYKKPDLALIDGIESSSRELGGEVTRYDLMILSEDPVAADAVGANILGLNPLSVPHLKLAQEKGLGMARLEEIDVEEIN
ncbi:MAG: hypothetical protein H8D26_04190 [Methanomicrobia archaeon]|nr:hypothetical protein [Methanomicrobia archaeon]